jgi:hypothetical protein
VVRSEQWNELTRLAACFDAIVSGRGRKGGRPSPDKLPLFFVSLTAR